MSSGCSFGDHHGESPALLAEWLFNESVIARGHGKLLHYNASGIRETAFPAPQNNFDFYLMALFQEFFGLGDTDGFIVLADAQRQAQAFDIHLFLLGFLLLPLFVLFILKLAVIKNFANRRVQIGLDFRQIQPFFLGQSQGFGCRHRAEVLAAFINHCHLGHADKMVNIEPRRLALGQSFSVK